VYIGIIHFNRAGVFRLSSDQSNERSEASCEMSEVSPSAFMYELAQCLLQIHSVLHVSAQGLVVLQWLDLSSIAGFDMAAPAWYRSSGGGCRKLVVLVGACKDRGISAEIRTLIMSFLHQRFTNSIDNSRRPLFFFSLTGSADDMWVLRNQRHEVHGSCSQLRVCIQSGFAMNIPHFQISAEAPF
jgi:hypothetical protein